MVEQLNSGKSMLAKTREGAILEGKIDVRHSSAERALDSLLRRSGRYETLGAVAAFSGTMQVGIGILGSERNIEIMNSSLSTLQKVGIIFLSVAASAGSAVFYFNQMYKCDSKIADLKNQAGDLPTISVPHAKA